MKPKIKNQIAWEQAELLMQPILLRVLDNIRKELDNSVWKGTYQEVQIPLPGYVLVLELENHKISMDIWELCYQVCFVDYRPTHATVEAVEVDIDTSLIDETGDVDWQRLDEKAQNLIIKIFSNLPKINVNANVT